MKHQHCPPFETNLAKNGNTPCSFFFLSFGCLESGPNDSTRVRRHTGIIRRARVKIFIQLMGAFGSNFPDFRAIWLGTTKPKLQNLYEAADQNIRTFTSRLFLRKAGGMSILMQTLQNLGLSTTARNFLRPFSESARNFRLSGRVRTCK